MEGVEKSLPTAMKLIDQKGETARQEQEIN